MAWYRSKKKGGTEYQNGDLKIVNKFKQNITTGYISNGIWYYTTSYNSLNTIEWKIESGKTYQVTLTSSVEKMRGITVTTDLDLIRQNTNGVSAPINTDSPIAYQTVRFTSTINGYFALYVGSQASNKSANLYEVIT